MRARCIRCSFCKVLSSGGLSFLLAQTKAEHKIACAGSSATEHTGHTHSSVVRRMWSAVHGAGAEAKTLDMDVERASQAATPEGWQPELECYRTETSSRRTKARSKTFDLGTVYVCV